MKRTLSVILGASLLITFCNKGKAPGLKLAPPEWTDNEINHYRILAQGKQIGSHILSMKLGKSDNIETIELNSWTHVKSKAGESQDSSWLVVRRDNLRPIHGFRALQTGGQNLRAEVIYKKDKASIKAKTPIGDKLLDIPIGPTYFDNDEMTTLLRALVLKTDGETKLDVVVGLGGSSAPVRLKMMGTEKLEHQAGSFECNKLQMNLAGQTINLWYEKTGMKRLVRYEAPSSGLVMELMPVPENEKRAQVEQKLKELS